VNPQLFGNLGQFDYSRLGPGDSPALAAPSGAYAYGQDPFQQNALQQMLSYISGMANQINPSGQKMGTGQGGIRGGWDPTVGGLTIGGGPAGMPVNPPYAGLPMF
jgi:hypothetical protein